jgi:hypothetical protein
VCYKARAILPNTNQRRALLCALFLSLVRSFLAFLRVGAPTADVVTRGARVRAAAGGDRAAVRAAARWHANVVVEDHYKTNVTSPAVIYHSQGNGR